MYAKSFLVFLSHDLNLCEAQAQSLVDCEDEFLDHLTLRLFGSWISFVFQKSFHEVLSMLSKEIFVPGLAGTGCGGLRGTSMHL